MEGVHICMFAKGLVKHLRRNHVFTNSMTQSVETCGMLGLHCGHNMCKHLWLPVGWHKMRLHLAMLWGKPINQRTARSTISGATKVGSDLVLALPEDLKKAVVGRWPLMRKIWKG